MKLDLTDRLLHYQRNNVRVLNAKESNVSLPPSSVITTDGPPHVAHVADRATLSIGKGELLSESASAAKPAEVSVKSPSNPKDLMGRRKTPILSVVPPTSIIAEAAAMQYGAFEALKADGSKGYGPYNFRDVTVEAMTYIDAAMRHMLDWVDGEELADDSLIHHLWHAKASLGILIDAIERKQLIDNRPTKGAAAEMLMRLKRDRSAKQQQS